MLRLNHLYHIQFTQDCVILHYKKVHNTTNPKTGRNHVTTWQTYHSTLSQALSRFVDCELKEVATEQSDIKKLIAKIETLDKQLNSRFFATGGDFVKLGEVVTDEKVKAVLIEKRTQK